MASPAHSALLPPGSGLALFADALVIGALPYPRSLSAQRNGERASILGGSVTCSDFRLWLQADFSASGVECPLMAISGHAEVSAITSALPPRADING